MRIFKRGSNNFVNANFSAKNQKLRLTDKTIANLILVCLITLMSHLAGVGGDKFDAAIEFQRTAHGYVEYSSNAVHIESEKGHLTDQETLITDRSFFSSSESFWPSADHFAFAHSGLSPPLRPPRTF